MPSVALLWRDEVAPGDAFGFAKVREPNRSRDRLHSHRDFAELFWVEQGQGVHIINGQAMPIKSGDAVLVRPSDVHNFQPVDDSGFQFVNLTFPLGTLNHLKDRYFREVPGFYDPREALPAKKPLNTVLLRWLEDAVPALAQAPRTRLEIEAFLITYFHELFFPSIKVKLETCPEWIRQVCEDFRKPANLAGGVKAFTSLAGRSHEHVARETKRWLGRTPTELVNQARLDFAAQQLSMTNIPICDVAMDVGFNNLAHFYRLFRKQFGVTPRKYRLKNQFGVPPAPGQQTPFYFKPELVLPKSQNKR